MASSDLLPHASTRWPCWFDSPIQMTARMRACRFSSARPSSFSALLVGVEDRRDRDRVEVQAGALGELGGVGARVLARPLARVGDAEDVLGAERVDGDGGDERGVDAAGQAQQDAGEAVLARRSRAARATMRLVPLAEVVPALGDGGLERGVRLERARPRSPCARRADPRTGCRDRASARWRPGGRGRRPAARTRTGRRGPRSSPSASTTSESPSKTSSSWPPTRLT